MFYRIITKEAPAYLINILHERVETRTAYNLRNKEDLSLPKITNKIYENSFIPSATMCGITYIPDINTRNIIYGRDNETVQNILRILKAVHACILHSSRFHPP